MNDKLTANFAAQHSVRTKLDEEGIRHVLGKYGSIYIDRQGGQLLYTDGSPQRWRSRMREAAAAGLTGGPTSQEHFEADYEIVGGERRPVAPEEMLRFDPSNAGQTATALRVIQARKRRTLTPEQKATAVANLQSAGRVRP